MLRIHPPGYWENVDQLPNQRTNLDISTNHLLTSLETSSDGSASVLAVHHYIVMLHPRHERANTPSYCCCCLKYSLPKVDKEIEHTLVEKGRIRISSVPACRLIYTKYNIPYHQIKLNGVKLTARRLIWFLVLASLLPGMSSK